MARVPYGGEPGPVAAGGARPGAVVARRSPRTAAVRLFLPEPSPLLFGAAVKRVLKVVAFVLVALVVVGLGVYAWASMAASRKLSRSYTAHTVDFPIPFPLPEEEVRRLALTPESAQLLARDRALERGRHLIDSR